jgi:hypothetical protein
VLYLRFTFIPLDIEIFLNNPYLALNLFRLAGLSGLRPFYLRHLIDLIILYTSLIDYNKYIINLIDSIDFFKKSIFVYYLDCL